MTNFAKQDGPPIGLSVLTWKSPKTLESTLKSLMRVADIFSERYVICQQGDPEEMAIAAAYGYTPIATEENLGIQEGLARCGEAPVSERIVIVEGDNMLCQSEDAPRRLRRAITLLDERDIHVFQFQKRPNQPSDRFRRYWRPTTPLQPTITGRMRRGAALARMYEAVSLEAVAREGNEHIEKLEEGFFLTNSACVNWSNRPLVTTKSFFLGKILPFARNNPGTRRINGLLDLEHQINCPANRDWWRGNAFRVGIAHPGLFDHARLERPDDDEKTEI